MGFGFRAGVNGPKSCGVWASVPYALLACFWTCLAFVTRRGERFQFRLIDMFVAMTAVAALLYGVPRMNPMPLVAITLVATLAAALYWSAKAIYLATRWAITRCRPLSM